MARSVNYAANTFHFLSFWATYTGCPCWFSVRIGLQGCVVDKTFRLSYSYTVCPCW